MILALMKLVAYSSILFFININEAGGIQFYFGFFREVVQELINEYHAATKPDYITWGTTQVNFLIIFSIM